MFHCCRERLSQARHQAVREGQRHFFPCGCDPSPAERGLCCAQASPSCPSRALPSGTNPLPGPARGSTARELHHGQSQLAQSWTKRGEAPLLPGSAVLPASPTLCPPEDVSLCHPLLLPLPFPGSCSWPRVLSVLRVLLGCHGQGAAGRSERPEPPPEAPLPPELWPLPQPDPSFSPPTGFPGAHRAPRRCWRQAEPPSPSSHLGAAAPSPQRSRTATKKPWVSVSAGEARRQLSAPGKAPSPRQGQPGKAFTSLG